MASSHLRVTRRVAMNWRVPHQEQVKAGLAWATQCSEQSMSPAPATTGLHPPTPLSAMGFSF